MSRFMDIWRVNSSKRIITKQASINWISLVYFASGACSLIDEVVWVRLLKLTLGNTVYASSIVVSMFMGGLALGALIMSRYSDRVKRRLRLYALLETLVTISALLLPFALKLADHVYVWIYRTYHLTHIQILIVQIIISALILLVPAMLMGSTLPLLGRFVTALEKEAGHLVGKLYALNTLGAATGCFLAGFVLIRAFGVMGTLYIAAGLNLLVAFGGWFLSSSSKIQEDEEREAVPMEIPEAAATKMADGRFYLLIFALFMSGLISIGYELLWIRSIVHLLGGYTYVFSAVLTVYLLGNVIGAGLGSLLTKRLKAPATGFAITLSLLGLYGILYLPLLVLYSSKLLPGVDRMLQVLSSLIPISSLMIGPLLQGAFIFLVPTIIMGIGFPIALQAWTNHVGKVGRATGAAYGANTIGAVIGGIAIGFLLIPLLGVQVSISILGIAGVWIAGLMWFFFIPKLRVVRRWVIIATAVLLSIITLKIPTDLFNEVVRKGFRIPLGLELVSMKEGTTTTVSIHKDLRDGTLAMYSSGQSIAGESYSERGDQKTLGHLGVLINSEAHKVLSVGFGSGETTACLSKHNLSQIDCVEIAPEIVEVSLEFFKHMNLGDRLDQEVNMVFMDAKNYIHLTDRNYDLIINDSIHPRDFAENASLYSKEYFESAKKRLNGRGMIISWLPTYNMTLSVFTSIIGTLMDVFPHVTLWFPTPHPAPLILIAGSDNQQYFSIRHIENELRKERVRESLAKIDVYNSQDVISCYIGDENDLKKCIQNFHINSDYWPFVEFTTDDMVSHNEIYKKFILEVRSDSIYNHLEWNGLSQKEKEAWLTDYQRLYKVSSYLFKAGGTSDALTKLNYCMKGLALLPTHQALINTKSRVETTLYSFGTDLIMSGKTDDALILSKKIMRIHPGSGVAWTIKSLAMLYKGDTAGALAAAQRAVEYAPDNELTHQNLAIVLLKLGRVKESIIHFQEAVRRNPGFAEGHYNLGNVYFGQSQFNRALYHYSEAVRLKPEYLAAHNSLGNCLAILGRVDDAIEHFSIALQIDPDDKNALNSMAWILATQKDPQFRDGSRAVQLAERVCKITGHKDPLALDTLAAAYAETGDFEKAQANARKAIAFARSAGQRELAERIEKRRQLYKMKNPVRQSSFNR